MHIGREVTIGVTIHDGMLDLRPNGVESRHLGCNLWARFGKIFCQESINEPKLGGMVEFEFKKNYKIQRATQQTTLGHFRIERLSETLSVVS